MINIEDKVKCSGCFACNNVCPVNAINMVDDNEGFWYPQVDASKCIECNKCDKVCPYKTNVIPEEDKEICYAAYTKNEVDRASSSSGGIFVSLAKYILANGGVVYGAAYNEEFLAYHTSATNEHELSSLIGSKYMQSRIGDCFNKIKALLENGNMVLFVGTACQVAGLKGFLQKEYDNLITVDFICLGVPSPKVWQDYLDTFFDKSNVRYVNFKDKSIGWHRFSLRVDDKKINIKDGRKTYFFTGYFRQLYSRPSCSNCLFKGKNRVSDITISDCWGYSQIAPEMDDNKGLSSIECHTEKGQLLFEKIMNSLYWKNTDIEDVKLYNSNYYQSAPMSEKRSEFWEDYDRLSKVKLFKKYCEPEKTNFIVSFMKKLDRNIRKVFK